MGSEKQPHPLVRLAVHREHNRLAAILAEQGRYIDALKVIKADPFYDRDQLQDEVQHLKGDQTKLKWALCLQGLLEKDNDQAEAVSESEMQEENTKLENHLDQLKQQLSREGQPGKARLLGRIADLELDMAEYGQSLADAKQSISLGDNSYQLHVIAAAALSALRQAGPAADERATALELYRKESSRL